MYFDTSILRSPLGILFQWLLPKLGSQAHFNTMCFSFAAKMAADTNLLCLAGQKTCATKPKPIVSCLPSFACSGGR